ncbi:MAG: preprotein translocase subunit YajC [Acidobacteria bacterium]|nr:preprotein translocase subunit YajC [Acidobacteriota bacterium]
MTNPALILLQNQPTAGGGLLGTLSGLLPFLLIFGVFYFLIIVPQRRRQKALQEMITELKAGDRIVTTGGIIATVTAVRETSLLVRSADKSILEISRSAVGGLQAEEEKGA